VADKSKGKKKGKKEKKEASWKKQAAEEMKQE